MSLSSITARTPRKQWQLWAALALVQILLMGAAFVGGRLIGQQNLRTARPQAASFLPAQLPKETPADSGVVQSIQGQVVTLQRNQGGARAGGTQATSRQGEVLITDETKFYKATTGAPDQRAQFGTSVQPQAQATEATAADLKVGSNIMVWGPKSGERVTAEVIYIQTTAR